MRRLLLLVPFLCLFACGDDDKTAAEKLGDDPTKEECIEVLRDILGDVEVPDGVDPSDGLDDEERPKAEAAIEDAFKGTGIDPDAEDDACTKATEDMTAEEFEEAVKGIDPEVLQMLGAEAAVSFDETGDSISG
jgi:hypothetical protein